MKLKKEIKSIGVQLKNALGLILYNPLIHQINKTIGSRGIAILSRHKEELEKFQEKQHNHSEKMKKK